MGSKKKWIKYILLALLIALAAECIFHPVEAKADFGDFSGDTDFGGAGGGGFGGGDGSSGSSSLDSTAMEWGLAILLIIGLMIFFAIKDFIDKLRGKTPEGKPAGAQITPDSALKPMREYRVLDPGFNEAAFREHMSNLYVQMQQEWHNRNIEPLKPYMTDAFWNQMDRQLDQKRRAGQTPCTERVAVLEATPRGFYQSAGMDHIVIRVRARLTAYILDDRTGKVISGSRNKEKFMEYEWDVCRKSGVITGSAGMQSVSCPKCGAPLNINQTAKCPYCGSIVTLVNEDWALNNIKGVSQQTV